MNDLTENKPKAYLSNEMTGYKRRSFYFYDWQYKLQMNIIKLNDWNL